MVSEHGTTLAQKDLFLKGYNELLNRIEPEYILCYNTPFPEMEGNIITVDYDLSSWKHMEDDKQKSCLFYEKDNECDIIKQKLFDIIYSKGMGSSRAGRVCIIFREQRVYIHDELFDLDQIDDKGRTNRERMKSGLAPMDKSGKPIHIHHINQKPDGDLEEMLQTVHNRNTRELHSYRNQPSRIDRNRFNSYRRAYWKYRLTRYVEDKE